MSWRLAPWQPRWSRRLSQLPPDNDSGSGSDDGGEESEEEELNVDTDGRVAIGGTMNYATRVYLADAAALSLSDAAAAFTARDTGGEYSRGTTFWVGAADAPNCALERLALEIFRFHARDAVFDPKTSGAEWWTLVIDGAADDVAFHFDRDYDMEADQGILLHPHLATVTYLTDGGAPTLVLERPSPLLAQQPCTGPVPAAEACWPAAGRHLAFDGRMLHGAPSGLGGAPAARGRRCNFLVNVWLNHVPWGAERYKGGGGGGGRGGRALRLDAAPPVERVERRVAAGGGDAKRWTFGDEKARLELALPWPTEPLRGGFARVEFGEGAAEVRAAPARKRRRAS